MKGVAQQQKLTSATRLVKRAIITWAIKVIFIAQIWISTAKCFGAYVGSNPASAKNWFSYNVTSVRRTTYKGTKARVTAELSHPKTDTAKIITEINKDLGASGPKTKIWRRVWNVRRESSLVQTCLPYSARTCQTPVRTLRSELLIIPRPKLHVVLKSNPFDALFSVTVSFLVFYSPKISAQRACISNPVVQVIHSQQRTWPV